LAVAVREAELLGEVLEVDEEAALLDEEQQVGNSMLRRMTNLMIGTCPRHGRMGCSRSC